MNGKHPVTGQLVVVVHLALKRLENITAPNKVIYELFAWYGNRWAVFWYQIHMSNRTGNIFMSDKPH